MNSCVNCLKSYVGYYVYRGSEKSYLSDIVPTKGKLDEFVYQSSIDDFCKNCQCSYAR